VHGGRQPPDLARGEEGMNPKSFVLLLCMAGYAMAQSAAARVELLWPEGAPGAMGSEDLDRPALSIYLPPADKASGAAVVICPGGSYRALSMDLEGRQVAEWMNARGLAAFVLKYRLGPRYHYPAQLDDAQRALRYVRLHAGEFHIQANRVGIMGFSAGGHLASTAGTHFDAGKPDAADAIDRLGSRPDFLILGYPVITLEAPYAHEMSRRMLLGDQPDPKLVQLLSNEKQVTAQTPPTFLFHTDGDKSVPAENSVFFYLALRKAGVPAEMHVYQRGAHGAGLGVKDAILASWPARLADWLSLHELSK
jgi:acetyl esterase/lipase